MAYTHTREFCKQVCSQVRWKPAHRDITQELQAHIEDYMEELLLHGTSPEEAEQRAVAAMGDPADIGRQLDAQHHPVWGWLLRLTSIAMMASILFLVIWTVLNGLIFFSGFHRPNYYVEKGALAYEIKLNESKKLNTITYVLDSVKVTNDGGALVEYHTLVWNPVEAFNGWSSPTLYVDDTQNQYWLNQGWDLDVGGAMSAGTFYCRGQVAVENLPPDLDELVLCVSQYDQRITFHIPLREEADT